MTTRIISDTHGKYIPYAQIALDADAKGLHTLQIGDMGFSYGHFEHFGLTPDKHRFISGNHDNYTILLDPTQCPPHYLGDFGEIPGQPNSFFVRGAFSIDRAFRTEGVDWWAQEELGMADSYMALQAYTLAKPSLMITHDCPDDARDVMIDKGLSILDERIQTRTGQLLQSMFEVHQPKLWIFGHWHQDTSFEINGTKFICLGELSYIDI